MSAPLKGFPYYFKTQHYLLAFLDKDKMFKIEMRGTNKNPGLAVDYYCTRKMVMNYWPVYAGDPITAEKFEELYRKLFENLIHKIIF